MYARPLPLRLLHPPPWPYASRPNQMTLKGCSACPPARSATANPLFCGSSRPNQMTLKGLSACPPAPRFPRSTRPPWPSTPMAPIDPCLHGPMAPGGMSPCFDGQPPTLWLLAPWPHLKGPSACPPPHGPQCLHASTANPYFVTPGPMAPWSPSPMPLDPIK